MASVNKNLIYTAFGGSNIPLPQHEGKNGDMVLSGEKNPLPFQIMGDKVEQQLTDADAVAGELTFSANIQYIGLYNRDATTDAVFNVNGIDITMPPTMGESFHVGGTPSPTVTVTGVTSYIVTRYV